MYNLTFLEPPGYASLYLGQRTKASYNGMSLLLPSIKSNNDSFYYYIVFRHATSYPLITAIKRTLNCPCKRLTLAHLPHIQ